MNIFTHFRGIVELALNSLAASGDLPEGLDDAAAGRGSVKTRAKASIEEGKSIDHHRWRSESTAKTKKQPEEANSEIGSCLPHSHHRKIAQIFRLG